MQEQGLSLAIVGREQEEPAVHTLCSTVKAAPGQCHGKDGATAVTIPVTSSAALASGKTVKREKGIATACLQLHSRAALGLILLWGRCQKAA